MFTDNPFYHQTLRKIVSAFGTMFNNVWLAKYDSNLVEQERIKVPLSFAQKEKYIVALIMDSDLSNPMQTVLPRMSYELMGMSYDPQRKLPSLNSIFSRHPTDKNRLYQNYSPVPYNFEFSLNIYTRNIEDMAQIMEQIVPYFTPDYTVTVALVQDNGQTLQRDIPILIGNPDLKIEYQGDGLTPRYVTCEIPFTLQAYFFGPTINSAIIRKAITSIYDTVGNNFQETVTMAPGGAGTFNFQEEIYSGTSYNNPNWIARVLAWNSNTYQLTIYEVNGKSLPAANDVVVGLDSGAVWTLATPSTLSYIKLSQTVITPVPNTSNVGDANVSFSANTTEFPNVANP